MFTGWSRLVTALIMASTLLAGCGGGGGGGGTPAGGGVVIPTTYSISGKVIYNGAGVPGVTVNLASANPKPAKTVEGAAIASTVTDNTGTYTFTVSSAGTFTVSSADASYGFPDTAVTVSSATVAVPVIAAFPLYTVSGKISLNGTALDGITVSLTGDATGSKTSASGGLFSFTGLRSGSYTITPSSSTYTFSPVNTALTVTSANMTGQDFTATVKTYAVSGQVTSNGTAVAGLVVKLASSAGDATATTDATGTYQFNQVSSGTYAISSADTKYTFTSVNCTVNGAAVTVPAIAAFPLFTVTGSISLNGAALGGATVTLYKTSYTIYQIDTLYGTTAVTLDPNGAVTQTTGTDGVYTFTNVRSGTYTIKPSSTQYVFKLASLQTLDNSGVVTITDGKTVYLYNPEGTGNKIDGNGTIIYNTSKYTLTDNTISGMNFLASVPAPTGN